MVQSCCFSLVHCLLLHELILQSLKLYLQTLQHFTCQLVLFPQHINLPHQGLFLFTQPLLFQGQFRVGFLCQLKHSHKITHLLRFSNLNLLRS